MGTVNHLLRSLAPITPAGWDLLDQEARERLTVALAARKLVDFSDPHGWEHSATNRGRTEAITKPRLRVSTDDVVAFCRSSSRAPDSASRAVSCATATAARPTWT